MGVDSVFINSELRDETTKILVPERVPRNRYADLMNRGKAEILKMFGQRSQRDSIKTHPQVEAFSRFDCASGRSIKASNFQFDIINLHWIANFIDLQTLISQVGGRIPLVWTLHDMRAFTGGCHYDGQCGKFMLDSGCHTCPQLLKSGPNDASFFEFSAAKSVLGGLDRNDLQIVTPSAWLADQSRKSKILSRFNVSVIPNGIDTDVFKPIDQSTARKCLGIAEQNKVLLFVAQDINNHRKGLDLLMNAIHEIAGKIDNLHLLTVGDVQSSSFHNAGIESTNLGTVVNERFLPIAYSAADLFTIPSRQDNLPNTVLESIACGTPVVGFRAGGIPELIKEGKTGWIVDKQSSCDLATKIVEILNVPHKVLSQLRLQCSETAQNEWSIGRQAESYKSLYSAILG